jgi:hypothetical protein
MKSMRSSFCSFFIERTPEFSIHHAVQALPLMPPGAHFLSSPPLVLSGIRTSDHGR